MANGMRCVSLVLLLLSSVVSPSYAAGGGPDVDPLRHFLPRPDIYMQVPGGITALTSDADAGRTIDDIAANRHGGLIVGYCLRASCRYVTHLAVLQVCSNRIGGPGDSSRLVLAIIRLPYGNTPGFIKSLQGRNYAFNFAAYGMFDQTLTVGSVDRVEALYALSSDGVGPVAEIDYLGQAPSLQQSSTTLAMHMTMMQNPASGLVFPHLEIRHYCEQPVS